MSNNYTIWACVQSQKSLHRSESIIVVMKCNIRMCNRSSFFSSAVFVRRMREELWHLTASCSYLKPFNLPNIKQMTASALRRIGEGDKRRAREMERVRKTEATAMTSMLD